jgi:hypothetical protein
VRCGFVEHGRDPHSTLQDLFACCLLLAFWKHFKKVHPADLKIEKLLLSLCFFFQGKHRDNRDL